MMASLKTEVDIALLGREIRFMYSHLLIFKLKSCLYGRAVEDVDLILLPWAGHNSKEFHPAECIRSKVQYRILKGNM